MKHKNSYYFHLPDGTTFETSLQPSSMAVGDHIAIDEYGNEEELSHYEIYSITHEYTRTPHGTAYQATRVNLMPPFGL